MGDTAEGMRSLNDWMSRWGLEPLTEADIQEVPEWREKGMDLYYEMRRVQSNLRAHKEVLAREVFPRLLTESVKPEFDPGDYLLFRAQKLQEDYAEQTVWLERIISFLDDAFNTGNERDAMCLVFLSDDRTLRRSLPSDGFHDQRRFLRACYNATFSFSSPPN